MIKGDFRVLWEGDLPLSHIHWDSPLLHEFSPGKKFETAIQQNWTEHKVKYPGDYDGISLFLYDYEFIGTKLILKVGTVRFSTIIYMYKYKMPVDHGFGLVGIQSLIFSPDKSHLLIGKRAYNQEYFPGALTLPGGITEVSDYMCPASESLMREIYEEVPVELEPNPGLFAILIGWNPVSITFLLYNTVKKTENFELSAIVSSEVNEWDGNLKWISLEELKVMDYSDVINGLYYYKWKIQ